MNGFVKNIIVVKKMIGVKGQLVGKTWVNDVKLIKFWVVQVCRGVKYCVAL